MSTTFLYQWARIGSFLFFFGMTSFLQAATQQLKGHIPLEVARAPFLGAMDTTQSLDLSIGLPLRNTDQLNQLLKDLYDPKSVYYRHFLTPDQFTAQFGPSPSDYQAVMDFAQAHHLAVTRVQANRLLVDVQGSVDDIQKTFHVHLNRYQRTDGTEFHAPDQEPSVDLDIPIGHVSNLEDFQRPRPGYATSGLRRQFSSSFSPSINGGTSPYSSGDYFGTDYRNAYVPGCITSSFQGQGQAVALVEFDRYNSSDVTNYANAATLGSPAINNIGIDGFSAISGTPVISGDDGEIVLDIEMVISMAKSAVVNVYEDDPRDSNAQADDLLNKIAIDNTAKQISCSWTGFGDSNTAGILAEYVAQGQSFFQAAGDLGAYTSSDPKASVPNPIDLTSNMTVVGGTQLSTSNGPTYQSESVWNSSPGATATAIPTPPNAVSGGGICTGVLAIPTYQIPFNTNGASSSWRNIPDVSMVAIGIDIYWGSPDTNVGGTSAAAPLWAGLMALINQEASQFTKGPIGFLNPYLYTLANNGGVYTGTDFHDVQSGNNNYWGTQPVSFAAATPGYDLATGLGSPNCNLVNNLIGLVPTNTITPTPTNSPTVTNTPLPPTTTSYYVYPQPAHGQVSIAYNSDSVQSIKITVYNLVGQLVGTFTDNAVVSNQNRTTLSLTGFAPGVYYFVMTGSAGLTTKGKFLAEP